MPTNVNNADNEQENEPVNEEADHTSQEDEENNIEKDYIKLDTYENKYYPCDSDSKALFALTDEPMETLQTHKEGAHVQGQGSGIQEDLDPPNSESTRQRVPDNVDGGEWAQSMDIMGFQKHYL
ncbi:hypothetical protein C0995_007792 [Termitomyces sp. Mi166|nr:hypothetical protein C0995_007792 [Termitomyces sp. Mi166\